MGPMDKDAWTMLFFSGSFFVLCWLVFQSKITSKVFASAVIGLAIFDLLVVDNKIINPDRSSGRGSQLISKDLCVSSIVQIQL